MLIEMTEKGKVPNDTKIYKNQVQKIKYYIQKIEYVQQEQLILINDYMDKINNATFSSKMYNNVLQEIASILLPYIEETSLQCLIQLGLFPIPHQFLPAQLPF
jgi:hypothetical protein